MTVAAINKLKRAHLQPQFRLEPLLTVYLAAIFASEKDCLFVYIQLQAAVVRRFAINAHTYVPVRELIKYN